MSTAAIAGLVAFATLVVLVPTMWAIYRKEQRAGDEARALLEEAREDVGWLKDEVQKLGGPLETPSERRRSAAAELAARGVSDD